MAEIKILVVEDDRIIADDIQITLNNLGYAVSSVVSSGLEAIKKAEEDNPDLVLMDIILEGEMDGIEAADQIHSHFNIPVVFLTAHANKKMLERAKVTEPFGYIIKPFEDRVLHSVIEIALYKHRMEKKLKESEEWLSTTLKSIGDAVIATDKKGNVTFMNPVAKALTGWKEEKAIGRHLKYVFKIINEETGKPVEDPVEKVLQEVAAIGLPKNTILIAKDGSKLPIDDSGSPIKDDKGNIIGVVLVFRDITERKRMEEKLRKSEERAKAQYRSIPIPTYTWQKVDDSFVLIDYNKVAEKISLGKITNLLERKAEELYPNSPRVLEDMSRCFTEKTIIKREMQPRDGLTNKGRYFDFTYAYVPPDYVMLHTEDITKEKEIDRMKNEFISIVSHELRTPLSITKEAISLILDRVCGEINEQQNETLTIAKRNIDRLARIVNDILDISKIEAGKLELKKAEVDVVSTIKTVVASFESKAKEKGLELRIKCPKEKIDIYVDEDKVIQLFTNLVDNAVKFTSEGFIEISAQEKENSIECAVADTGIGVPEEYIEAVFGKFKQLGRTGGPGEKGTGLGLSIVKGIVELHKGKIWVQSEVGKGTKFTFSLPILSSEEIFKEYLSDAIREAKEKEGYFSAIMISVQNFKEFLQESFEKAKGTLKKIEGVIKSSLRRRSDIVIKDTGEILLILPETGRKDAALVLGRLKGKLRQYLSRQKDLKGKINLTSKIISYPEEARGEKEILNKIKETTDG